MPDPPAKRAKSSGKPLELRYFTVLAKGLGPALVLEYSGLEWLGSKGLGFTRDMWPALKPGCPFGQLPLLVTADGTQIAQTTAIMNYVGRLAGTEGDLNEFALSQMLMAEAEDIYHLAQKSVPTLFMKLGQGIKGSPADYEAFWSEKLPTHLEALERLCSKRGANGFGSTPGALYLWSILHQLALVSPDMLAAAAGKQPGTLAAWYASLLREPKVQKVLSGESSMGELRQYFVAHEPASGGSKL